MNTREMALVVIVAVVLLGGWFAFQWVKPSATVPSQPEVKSLLSTLNELNSITDIDLFFDQFFTEMVHRTPEWASSLRLFGGEPDPTGHLLDDISLEKLREDGLFAEAILERLRSFDPDTLNDNQRLTIDILDWHLEQQIRDQPFLLHNYRVHQLFGLQVSLMNVFLNAHQIRTIQNAENYVARLNAVDEKLNQLINILNEQETQGIVAPSFILESVLRQMPKFSENPEEHFFYTSFAAKLANINDLDEMDRSTLLAAAVQAVDTSVLPAFAALREVIEQQLVIATEDAGVWKHPNGDAYYAHQLRFHTTTDLSPEQVHQIGLAEVERIQQELRQQIGKLGIETSDPVFGNVMRAYWDAYGNAPELTYSDALETEQQVLDDYINIVHEAEAQVAGLFDILPKAVIQIRGMPPERRGAGAHYDPPAFDGSRPGVFFTNINPPPFKPGMRTLTYHEAIPGHHFQLALQQELDLPLARKILVFTAYVEGWGLYAETLMRELDMYPDVHSKIGNYEMELLRAGRLVADTGIHYKRWTRQQALDYYSDNLGGARPNEIDRYISWPGQATAYKIGELKILELRQRAMDELGEAFDIKTFHNVMLKHGQMPLAVLEQQVMDYIEQEKANL